MDTKRWFLMIAWLGAWLYGCETAKHLFNPSCDPDTDPQCVCTDPADPATCSVNIPDTTEDATTCQCTDGQVCQNGQCVTVDVGDVGTPCDPKATPTPCNYFCLELSNGGVCIDTCGNSGTTVCTGDYRCNEIPTVEGDLVEVCLPNASCGDLTYAGYCAGDILHYCDIEGAVALRCADYNGENGQPMQCVSLPEYSDCMSSDFSSGCGTESTSGRCSGNTLIYCESYASGTIRQVACADQGQICGIAPDGSAECRAAGTSGCGSVTYTGYCDGTKAVWCADSQIQQFDCTSENLACGYVDAETGYWCIPPVTSNGTYNVSGTFLYEKRPATVSGLGTASPVPVRQALVQVRQTSDHALVASGYTTNNGSFSIGFNQAPPQVYLLVLAAAENDRYAIAVRDCPLDNCNGSGNVYAASTEDFSPAAQSNLGSMTIGDNIAGAFNIFDIAIRSSDFAWTNLGSKPPSLTLQWASGSTTICETSCFSSYGGNSIYVIGTAYDSDEFDDAVLGHEFGHFLEHAYSRSDSPGGAHDGSPTDPRLAWGEGYGTYVGSVIFNTPVYIDTMASGASVTDISNTGIRANPTSSHQMLQPLSEFTVAEILWHIGMGSTATTALGNQRIFDVLSHYFTSNAFRDRGVSGVDLVDFLDGWFCRGHSNQTTLRAIVNTRCGFPYDYASFPSCP